MKARLRSESTLFNINDHECSQSTFPVYESLRKDGSIFFFFFFFLQLRRRNTQGKRVTHLKYINKSMTNRRDLYGRVFQIESSVVSS